MLLRMWMSALEIVSFLFIFHSSRCQQAQVTKVFENRVTRAFIFFWLRTEINLARSRLCFTLNWMFEFVTFVCCVLT